MTNEEHIPSRFTRDSVRTGRLVHTCETCGTVDNPRAHAMTTGHEVTSDRVR